MYTYVNMHAKKSQADVRNDGCYQQYHNQFAEMSTVCDGNLRRNSHL